MNSNYSKSRSTSAADPQKKGLSTLTTRVEEGNSKASLIRFEEKKERYLWIHPDDICFVKSADHYVKSLIKDGDQKKWMCRHCTLKELLFILPDDNFVRLNKFYILNRNHFSHINENEKLLYFNNNFSVPIPHRISPYLRHLLKAPIREMHFTK
ncbi:MAG: LytTR family DNA-binding domain-containing protein [Ginsengibacter sp.]